MDMLPIIVWTARLDGSIAFVNRRLEASTGIAAELIREHGWGTAVHPGDARRVAEAYAHAVRSGTPLRVECRLRHSDDTHHWVRLEADRTDGGDDARWFGVMLDVDDERRALTQFRSLAEALPVIVWTADASGSIDWYSQRWYDFTGQTPDEALGWGWQAAHHPEDFLVVMRRWPRSIESGEPFEMEFRLRRSDGIFRWFLTRVEPVRDEHGAALRWYGSHIDIDAQHRALERTARVAQTLQEVFLPKALPERLNLRMDAIYLPAEKDAHVGGDWFDAFELPDRRIVVSIGDVAGHGLDASITVGRMRQAIFTLAFTGGDPESILVELDRLLRYQQPNTMVTALVGFIDPLHTTFTYASAGHPPPLIAYKNDAMAHILPPSGLPLGAGYDLDLQIQRIPLEPDAVVALYTDGMTDFSRDTIAVELKLRTAVGMLAGDTRVRRPAAALRDLVFADQPATDDAALLLMQFSAGDASTAAHDEPVQRTWRFHSSDAHTAHTSRREIGAFIRSQCSDTTEVFTSELIVGEILANTVEHAPGLVEVHLDWTHEHPTLTVRDTGPGLRSLYAELPEDAFAEDGRGLFLVNALARQTRVTPLPGYGTEVRVVLPVTRTP